MVKKISVKQKQNVKQNVNVRVHIGDKKKKRIYRKKQSGSGGVSTESHGASFIPFTPVYIQSGNAPHLEFATIRTPAIAEPVPAVNRLGGEAMQSNLIPRGNMSEIVPVEKIPTINGGGVVSEGDGSRRTYKPRRSKEEIEAEKSEKEARRLDRQLNKK